ncbi:MAG: GtrA family protein [Hyphomicrobium sp.]
MARLTSRIPHLLRYVFGGGLSFATDVVVFWLLANYGDVAPWAARAASLFLALLVSWWMHRTVTFEVEGKGSLQEFSAFAMASAIGVGVNYCSYLLLTLLCSVPPFLGILLSSGIAMLFTYFGMSRWVFRAG